MNKCFILIWKIKCFKGYCKFLSFRHGMFPVSNDFLSLQCFQAQFNNIKIFSYLCVTFQTRAHQGRLCNCVKHKVCFVENHKHTFKKAD